MVAMNVWPTDGADGSVSSEARWRKMGRLWTPTGVASGVSTEMKPTLAGTNLTIKAGAAWVDGHYCELLGDQVLTVTANGLTVVRFDPAANTADLIYRDGATTPNQSPTGIWETPIAQIVGSALRDVRPFTSGDAWHPLTPLYNGWSSTTLAQRVVGDELQVRGSVGNGAPATAICWLPVPPPFDFEFLGSAWKSGVGNIAVTGFVLAADGNMQVRDGTSVFLDFRYSIRP